MQRAWLLGDGLAVGAGQVSVLPSGLSHVLCVSLDLGFSLELTALTEKSRRLSLGKESGLWGAVTLPRAS